MTSMKPSDEASPLVETYCTVWPSGLFIRSLRPRGVRTRVAPGPGCAGELHRNLLIWLMFLAGMPSRNSGGVTVVAGTPRHKDTPDASGRAFRRQARSQLITQQAKRNDE